MKSCESGLGVRDSGAQVRNAIQAQDRLATGGTRATFGGRIMEHAAATYDVEVAEWQGCGPGVRPRTSDQSRLRCGWVVCIRGVREGRGAGE